jgi:hypothetical protein
VKPVGRKIEIPGGTCRRLLVLWVSMVFLSLQTFSWADEQAYDYASSVGVAVLSETRVCLAINNRQLSPGNPVSLVVASIPQSLVQAEVVGPGSETCGASQLHDSGSNVYELRLRSGTLPPMMPVIAVTNSSRPLQKIGTVVSGDLAGNGGREFFRLCNSTEGIHLTVWSGKPLIGKRKWHTYYYLGYDMQPNCTSKDTADTGSHKDSGGRP